MFLGVVALALALAALLWFGGPLAFGERTPPSLALTAAAIVIVAGGFFARLRSGRRPRQRRGPP
jgi:hypothetical protein